MSDHQIDTMSSTRLADVRFQQLDNVPAAATWFANIANPQTRRAYQSDLTEFMTFTGIANPDQFRRGRTQDSKKIGR